MSALLTLQQFAPLIHQRFLIEVDEHNAFDVELIEVSALPCHPMQGGAVPAREPFSLIFRGPGAFYVPQRLYAFQNETLGRHELFMVPIGPDEVGHRYQVIFN